MKIEEFTALTEAEVAQRGEALRALWLEAHGDWDGAHAAAQSAGDTGDRAGDWVHAYLHRVEGDQGNANYWYHRAGRRGPASCTSLASERAEIVKALWSRGIFADGV